MNIADRRFFYQIFRGKSLSLGVILMIGFVSLLPSVSVRAATLAEYRKDVKAADLLIQNLLYADAEDDNFDDFAATERDTLKRVRALIPPTERIEWNGATVETDNRRLLETLDEFERLPPNDDRRRNVLSETGERLAAIGKKLDELENPAVSALSKDEEKRKLAEILRREEYQKPAEEAPSLAERIQKQIAEWLAEIFPRPNIAPSTAPDFQPLSYFLQIVLYALILGAVAFLIYRFAPFFIERIRRREAKEKGARVILGERVAADETARNLFAEAEDLARAGDLRGAIRKGYIALLCDLSDRRIIRLSQHKTNRDYLRDVRQRTELFQSMNRLTLNYERHWYGFDEANAADWENFRDGYQRAVQKG